MNGNGVANGYLNGSDGPYSDSDDDDDDEEGLTRGSVGRKLMVFDLRSYTAALGNRAKGGGCECTGESLFPSLSLFLSIIILCYYLCL